MNERTGIQDMPGARGTIILRGITHAGMAHAIGAEGAEFAGRHVRVITQGNIAALVSDANFFTRLNPPALFKPKSPVGARSTLLSALTSLMPLVAVVGDLRFSVGALCKLMAERQSELDEIVLQHSGFVECEVRAEFDTKRALKHAAAQPGLASLSAQSEAEQQLVERTITQNIAGRQGEFVARLRRILADNAADTAIPLPGSHKEVFARRVLIPRATIKDFRAALSALVASADEGAKLIVGDMCAPVHFRRLEVRGADITQIEAAREALGVSLLTDRAGIRIAYRRTIERVSALGREERDERLSRLNVHLGLLEMVADGQIKAANGVQDAPINLDEESLSRTWLLRFDARESAARIA